MFIVTDRERQDTTVLPETAEIDIEIGSDNDYSLTIPLREYKADLFPVGGCWYEPGTEYGGILDNPESSTKEKSITYSADTWRGLLSRKCIEPPSGEAFRVVSGELNTILRELLGGQFGTLFTVSDTDTGVSVRYQFARYCTLLDGITDMLTAVSYRLKIEAVEGEQLTVMLSAVPIVDYSQDEEFSQDGNVDFTLSRATAPINYMIVLGKGQLTARKVYYLHRSEDGTISEVSSIPDGLGVRVEIYNNTSTEDEGSGEDDDTDLIKEAKKRLEKLADTDSQNLTVAEDLGLELGDIVGGRDYITGMSIARPVTSVIYKKDGGKVSISYKVGG